jgi:glycosyltransferase involved in cell wall biosynthesis
MTSSRRLKITFYDASGRGGICHYTFQLAQSLAQAGCEVSVIAVEGYELGHLPRNFRLNILFKKSWTKAILAKLVPQGSGDNSRPSVVRQNSRSAEEWASKPSIVDRLKVLRLKSIFIKKVISLLWENPHVIHFQWLADRNGELFFMKLLKRCRFKIVYTAHDLLPHDMDTHANRRVFQTIYSLVDLLIVHADNIKQQMLEKFDVDSAKIHVIPHGSNAIFFDDQCVSKETARKEIGIPLGKQVILFFGLIKPYKGLEYLLEAFEEIKRHIENAMLLIVGRIADDDHQAYQYYSKLLSTLEDSHTVKCVTEYIPFNQVGQFFVAADLIALPHIKPSQSGVLLSAMAAGKAVVVTDAGGLGEVVKNGQSGFAVPPKDSKALAEAIIEIFRVPGLLERMGREARLIAETTYSWNTVASKTIEVYRAMQPGCQIRAVGLANPLN